MITGKHRVYIKESKKYPEFKNGEEVDVKLISRINGIYEVNGKHYTSKVLRGIMSPANK